MKKYIAPAITVLAIETGNILSGSADGINDRYSSGSQLSRRHSDFWEDEEEDWQ